MTTRQPATNKGRVPPDPAAAHETINAKPRRRHDGRRRGSNTTSEVPEMTPQTMQRGAPDADLNPTAVAERDADDTLDRLTRAREDADTPDDAAAEQAWRQVSRLASRLSTEARAIARTLEGAVIDQRELVADSLLQHPEAPARTRPR